MRHKKSEAESFDNQSINTLVFDDRMQKNANLFQNVLAYRKNLDRREDTS